MDISNFGLLMTAVDTHNKLLLAMFVLVLVKGAIINIYESVQRVRWGGGLEPPYVFPPKSTFMFNH